MYKESHNSDIRIDKEGQWRFREVEMIREDIVHYFYKHLKRDGQGRYLIEIEGDCCYVEVEDAPYCIRSVTFLDSTNQGIPCIELSLSDGTTEMLNITAKFRIGKDNVLYCLVKKGEHEARFLRPAYYQLCEKIEYDEDGMRYFLKVGHRSYPLFMIHDVCGETDYHAEIE